MDSLRLKWVRMERERIRNWESVFYIGLFCADTKPGDPCLLTADQCPAGGTGCAFKPCLPLAAPGKAGEPIDAAMKTNARNMFRPVRQI